MPSFAMVAGMELVLFTPLGDGPRQAEEIASAIGVGVDKLTPLLYVLVTTGLLTVERDLFSNSPEADHFLVRGKPTYQGERHQFFSERWNDALQSAESIRQLPSVYRGPYEYSHPDHDKDYWPQDEPA